ncbi:6,7-dimethyl-8-ribityllumazine synthase [Methylomarinovum tepidoasis]|uniref:6,7-dimethyl-8-ribityllumazine synthase n=1 Tax=Methylomarinovum tepidoasis TaxID=2840183 RepID=A0AAU9CPL5_9GAMM|nr:6,7-dimethyl-8-ribityllumazine synthase [Methylomarinovum sp. IN45]BCX89602.1 6,7-dimethyl-8-ribityllumazine synthase [Methylomarinovum sp. IN45]
MNDIQICEGQLNAAGMRFTLVAARFNGFIVDALQQGAIDALVRHGADPGDIRVVKVPGAFEMPLAIKAVAERGDCDAIIALGAVIRGATPHFDYVAGECVKGMAQTMMQYTIPVAFGVLTCDTIEQAIERAGTKAGNKGAEAAVTAIEMVDLLRRLKAS